ncbi:MAG: CapA family protein [Acidimicrobiia bacterium]|nr:CapA family protein [Acidimicrobiia bacterium]
MTTRTDDTGGRTTALSVLAIAMMVALVIAWRIDAEATTAPPEHAYHITVVDESEEPVPGATVEWSNGALRTDSAGAVTLRLAAPELIVVTAAGMLPDAVVVGSPEQRSSELRLLAATGPTGSRTVMHFGGDFMMGRRYLEPTRDDTPVVNNAASARAVVADIAPLFGLADLVSVNFESVIGDLAEEHSYAGKRFLLQSPPESLAALEELGVTVATLGNNHINDWTEAGVASTIRNLVSAGIAHPGGGLSAAEAEQPALLDAGGLRVGVISMTTVTGDYVNDSLPDAAAPVPAAISPRDMWQYEARAFGFGSPPDATYVPTTERRPGAMWELYREIERNVSPGDAADVWQAVSRTYPELQDWVARRGHGGAAHYSAPAVAGAVSTAREQGAEFVVVQLHGGLQFADVNSEFMARAGRTAIDAGADLVIGHHPHVLQGFEFYKGKLIAYSLGNLVFDQEFLITHPSVILRTVYEEGDLVEAKLYPIMIDTYRPVAVGGAVASRILRQVDQASLQAANSIRLPDRRVGSTTSEAGRTARVVIDNGRGIVVPAQQVADDASIDLNAEEPIALPAGLIETNDTLAGVSVGSDIFGFGDLEDVQADGEAAGGLEWVVPADSLVLDRSSPAGPWVVRLDRTSQHTRVAVARTASRVPLPRHRWFDDLGSPVDDAARYSVRVWAKRVGAGIPFVRVSYYDFDDTDPTRAPQSTALETVDIPLPLVNDGTWHELWVEVTDMPDAANAALFGVGLAPPESNSGTIWIDGLQVVEWHSAERLPVGTLVAADYAQATEDRTVRLIRSGT